MNLRTLRSAVSVFLLVSLSSGLIASEWHVAPPPLGNDGNPGTNELPFATIQRGIDAASAGDPVIVAQGTYVENIQFNGKNIVLTSIDPLNPSVVANTIIDGNKAGSVVTFSGTETEACVLSGFTIRNGKAEWAGGICGGTWDVYTAATIRNNTITDNSAANNGGGLCWCAGTIQNNTITGNSATTGEDAEGGGLAYCGGIIQKNTITGNSANHGGGLSLCYGIIQNNMISDNSALTGGGLAYCNGTIQNNTISDNSANDGGGLCSCGRTIQNNIITGNSAGLYGGGLWYCGGTIQSNTIAGNSASEGGGLYACDGTIRNCIIWGNTAPTDPQVTESSVPTFSCIQGWSGGGTGNIATDPQFPDTTAQDYHLQEGSPCIDAAASYYWLAWPQRDRDGNCRLAGLAVDMGCYEYGSSTDADGDLLSDSEESAGGTDPLRDDSDGDGLRDGLELLRGSDPLQVTAPGVLNVPSDFATIQESLCISIAGDEVIVAPGTYPENLQFCGPDIILRSSDPGDPNVVGSTVIDGGGAGPVVSFTRGESEACVLAGFTIRNGWATRNGGGICGGTELHPTHATIQNNTITANSAGREGGGLADCDGTIQNNTITGNSAESGGGLHGCDGMIQNNTITENSADWGGGGLAYCNGTVQNNTITGNSVTNDWRSGGGLAYCNGTIQNNTIRGNSAPYRGGGLYDCDGTIQNNMISGNWATYAGGGLYECHGTIRNCIIWANTAPTDPQLYVSSTPTYSCIEGWTGDPATGNISGDPRFAGPDTGDFRLLPDSPCIDAGSNDPGLPATDITGMHRIMFGGKSLTVDMGAYEYYVNALSRELNGNAALTWSSLAGKTYSVLSSSDMLAWQTAAEDVPSLGDTVTTWTDTTSPFLSPAIRSRYYRTVEK